MDNLEEDDDFDVYEKTAMKAEDVILNSIINASNVESRLVATQSLLIFRQAMSTFTSVSRDLEEGVMH